MILNKISEIIAKAGGLVDVISNDQMVLVCGMSRSGTTLLTIVLDSHPAIVCGAELLPTPIPSISDLLARIDTVMIEAGGDFTQVGKLLKKAGERDAGLFLIRCHRAGVTVDEVRDGLREAANCLEGQVSSLGERLLVAQSVMQKRAERTKALLYGFKFTSAAVEIAHAYLPKSTLLCIMRDPYDVVLSHQKRGFNRTVAEICKIWNVYAKRYREYSEKHPQHCTLIRYEDLVRQPRRTLQKVFEKLPVDLHPGIFEFYRSDSPIHYGFHPNAERLRMNFSTDGIGRGRKELASADCNEIMHTCKEEMRAYGYENPGHVRTLNVSGKTNLIRIGKRERMKQQELFSRKRKFTEEDYAKLLNPYLSDYEILPIGEYARIEEVGDRKILMIRHDVDHDLDTGLKIAAWEAERGIRATYCLLHTSWYYGNWDNGRYRHSDFLVDGIERLCDMGHEINFHNNLISIALREGVDPEQVLASELEFYDRLGVAVTGTSTHGDALCRDLNFRNWELFQECCDDRFGGPRWIEHEVNGKVRRCYVGVVSMSKFGLEYEAYDMGKDVYHTESGGNMRVREKTKARRNFGRLDKNKGSICGILTHPIWWDFG